MDYADLNLATSKSAFSSSSSSSCKSEASTASTSSNSSFTYSTNMSNNNLNKTMPNPTIISTPIVSSNNVFNTYANNSYTAPPYSSNINLSMTSSTSQIFATAASFNISSTDTVYYSRETIHYLAKFLSKHSNDNLFRSLYAFAPDNLAWLWAFFDWDTQLDLDKVEYQDTFNTFKTCTNQEDTTNNSNEQVKLDDEQINLINKIFSDAPLVQYVYREKMMIGDVYKILEHVQNIQDIQIAKALFLLYFPRFSGYLDNPLKNSLPPKILKANISRIKCIDDIIVSLIRSRYTNLNEYKIKIQNGTDLPSYIRSLLNENTYWLNLIKQQTLFQQQQQLQQFNQFNQQNISKTDLNLTCSSSATNDSSSDCSVNSLQNSFNLSKNRLNSIINDNVFSDDKYTNLIQTLCQNNSSKTNDYLKLLQKYTTINDDLDHVSFDTARLAAQQQQYQQQLTELDELSNLVYDDINNNCLLLTKNQFLQSQHQQEQYNLCSEKNNNESLSNTNNIKTKNENKFSNIKSISEVREDEEHEIAIINEEDDKTVKLITNSKLRPTANVFKLDNTKFYLNDIQAFDQLQVSCNSNDKPLMYSEDEMHLLSPIKSIKKTHFSASSTQQNNLNMPMSPTLLEACSNQQSIINGTNLIDESLKNNKLNSMGYNYRSNNSSPLLPNKSLLPNTPKTPGNLFIQQQQNQLNDQIWSNNNGQIINRGNYNRNVYSTDTPPPSASSLKTPLSVFTANLTVTELKRHDYMSPKSNQNRNQITDHHSFQAESLKYLNSSNFLSPAVRQHQTNIKFNDFSNVNTNISNSHLFNGGSSSSNSSGPSSLSGSKINLNNGKNLNEFNTYSNYSKCNDTNQYINNQFTSNYVSKNYNSMHHVWFGRLPPKVYSEASLYSRKVFLGGLPWDVNQQYLLQLLHKYGPVKLEIPGKDQKHPRASTLCKTQERSTPGYVYIIFEHESSVQRMLFDCRKELKNGGEHYYYTIFIPSTAPPANNNISHNSFNYGFHNINYNKQQRGKAKEVEVIPWNQDDTSYLPLKSTSQPAKIDARLTVFVGALHGMLNAQGLAKVMNELIGEVTHAGLDSDKYKYPIGSGRVTFKNRQSYVKAIKAKFVTIKANLDPNDPSPKFEKTIQIDPYLEDAKCCKCDEKSQYFCRNEYCLDYYCQQCWQYKHDTNENGEHLPLSRQIKPNHGC